MGKDELTVLLALLSSALLKGIRYRLAASRTLSSAASPTALSPLHYNLPV